MRQKSVAVSTTEWRPVPEWEGYYEVSSEGEARSVTRLVPHATAGTQRRVGRPLRPYTDHHGYLVYTLCRDGKTRRYGAHVLVAMAFCPGSGELVRHLDGDKTNNSRSNVGWGSYSQNTMDSVEHKTHHRASKTSCPNGHTYTPETVIPYGPDKRWRRCRICVREQRRRWMKKKRDT